MILMETILERSPVPTKAPALSAPRAARLVNPLWLSRVAVAALFFLNGALFGTWVARIPAVKSSLGLSDGIFGIALLAMAFGATVAMPLSGWLSGRWGSHRVCQAVALVFCGLLPVVALAPNLPVFVAAVFLFGATHGGLDVAMNAQAVDVEKRHGRSIMSSFHALFSAGGLAGAAGGGLIAAHGLPPLAHFAGVAGLLALVAVLAFPHLLDDRPPARAPRPGDADNEPHGFRFALPSAALVALGALAFSTMVGEGAMADWSALYLRRVLHSTEGLAAAGYAAFSITMAITRFFGDLVATHVGPVRLVRGGGLIALSGLALVLLSPLAGPALVGFACVGLGLATICPMTFSAAGRTPGMSAGAALSSVTTLGYLGFLIGPPLIGFAAEIVGLRSALAILVAAGTCIVALASNVAPPRPADPAGP